MVRDRKVPFALLGEDEVFAVPATLEACPPGTLKRLNVGAPAREREIPLAHRLSLVQTLELRRYVPGADS
jgi:hypothetical protein